MGDFGSQAGEMIAPRGIAIEPTTSHVYVADLANQRIDEFSPWGAFVKAFGWDVAPGAVDEEQEVRIRATAGQFRLDFEAATTPDLPFDATAGEVESALNGLSTIGGAGGSVTVEGGAGGITGTTPAVYVIRFDGGSLKATDLEQVAVSDGTTPLSGGSPTALEGRTLADGSAAGTGLETCTAASGCKAGSGGGEAGHTAPAGLAFDGAGDLYVFEPAKDRMQKFDATGHFIWMVGGEVNKTSGADFCDRAALEAAEECGVGIAGSGPREFQVVSQFGTTGDYVELGSDGNLYVGDTNRIQVIGTDGAFVREIKFSDVNAASSAFPAAGEPGGLAVDPVSGDLYFSFAQGLSAETKVDDVFRLSTAGTLLDVLPVEGPEAVGTDSEGDVYTVEVPATGTGGFKAPRVVAFDSVGSSLFAYPEGIEGVSEASLRGLATNGIGDLFVSNSLPVAEVSQVSVYGPPPLPLAPPPRVPPEIEDEYATSVDSTGAVVGARINPHLWSDTRYFVEYGTEPCASSSCAKVPAPPGDILTDEVIEAGVATEAVSLDGLQPDTTYHFRFVAESSGGGPTVGADSTFTTRREIGPIPPCPGNDLTPRSPLSERLPDCRAYEMVSPIDKNGGDLVPLCEILCYPAALDQSAESGSRLTYSTYNSFGDAESAPYASQYLASRTGQAWDADGISPPQSGTSGLDTLYKAFTPELEFGWITAFPPPPLEPGSQVPNIYRRDNGAGSYKALVGQALAGSGPEIQGVTPDGQCTVFRVDDKLSDNALENLTQVYKSCEGVVSLISVLPDGTAATKPSSAGSPSGFPNGREGSMFNALSKDGSRVFWSEEGAGSSRLYLRIDDSATKAISSGSAFFWGAADDGGRVIYQEGGSLKEATVDEAGTVATATIAGEAIGLAGMSSDALRVYFASREDLDGTGAAQAGEPNLYLLERAQDAAAGAGTITYVTALSSLDVQPGKVSPVAPRPSYRQSRVSPDGLHLAFMSRGQLTGYNNIDQESGEPDAEVFLYDAAADVLRCVSCNPTGARPVGQETRFGLKGSIGTGVWAAAKIPSIRSQLYSSRALSDGGSRLFFESYDQLSPDDESSTADVYQWEELGAGPAEDKCEATDAGFDPISGGCIDLISSGTSPLDVEFLDAGASGDDVFFSTSTSLIEADPGQIDIYDARVGGGLPEPPAPETDGEQCDPDTDCQPMVDPPPSPSPPESAKPGPPNDTYAPPKLPKRCPKGTHKVKKKGKVRCVKNKKAKKHKGGRAGKNRRAGA
jgi:DNA-binding beta-propeller fold protein YncE